MNEFLIVLLNRNKSSPILWSIYSLTNSKNIISGEFNGWENFIELTKYSKKREVCLLVPSSNVFLSYVTLPISTSRPLKEIMSYLLEDNLAQDIEELHFSILRQNHHGGFVCAIDKKLLHNLLFEFKKLGIKITKVLPDVLALPENDGLTAIKLSGEEWIIKKGQYLGISIYSDWLQELVNSNWVKQGDNYISLKSYTELPELTFNKNQIWETSKKTVSTMELLSQGAFQTECNLLTGVFKPPLSFFSNWKVWYKVFAVIILFIAMLLTNHILQILKLNTQAESYRAESERIFFLSLPNKDKISDEKYFRDQIQNEINFFSIDKNKNINILEWIADLTKSLQEKDKIWLQNIKFDANRQEMRIKVNSKDFQSLEKLRIELSNQFNVEQGQLERSTNDIVNGLFLLKK
ncbi:type II secretion system protein GspL [Candidatus Photodesmus anomalopis]|uniref:Type II secretion system protein L n=1 Tax=Candidatus Photodesmus katoptron Akat1 TaxID=1236703 RepID=S3DK60_9GAMM|nr:type II secretion system protein GspL [Candidatus Photodesmus katoptron]EPE37534.1 general secretion pathway protein L [Candidatus Photodesmus katoptron Akat1]